MALDPATITALELRWGETYLAQLTRRDTYINGDATYGTIDEDVLERAVQQAQQYVQTRIGAVDEDHWAVLDITPYTILPPGQSELAAEQIDRVLRLVKSNPMTTVTTAIAAGEDGDNRRFTGDEYEELVDEQSSSRPRRGTF